MDYSFKVRYQGRLYNVQAKDLGTPESRIEFKCLGKRRVVYEEIPSSLEERLLKAALTTISLNKIHEIVVQDKVHKAALKAAKDYGLDVTLYEMPD